MTLQVLFLSVFLVSSRSWTSSQLAAKALLLICFDEISGKLEWRWEAWNQPKHQRVCLAVPCRIRVPSPVFSQADKDTDEGRLFYYKLVSRPMTL